MSRWNITIPHRIPLREVWSHEQYDFSAWVKDNIVVVNEQVGLTIDPETLDPESVTGAFSADLVGTATDDADGNQVKVVIENQLERTDHDHLGKVLTYVAHHEADVAIWIAAEARPEHVRAIQWLNENSELKAWLFTIEAVAVGEQLAAPLLRRIVGPSLLTAHGSWVCLRLDADSPEEAEHYYQQMLAHRDDIDRRFGPGLEWKSDDSARARMRRWDTPAPGGYRDDPDDWPDATASLVDGLRRLVDATLPYVSHLTPPVDDDEPALAVAADTPPETGQV